MGASAGSTVEYFMKVAKCCVTETKTKPIAGYVSNLIISSERERVPHPSREWGCLEGLWSSSLLKILGDDFWMWATGAVQCSAVQCNHGRDHDGRLKTFKVS